jgi:hypothetical protein
MNNMKEKMIIKEIAFLMGFRSSWCGSMIGATLVVGADISPTTSMTMKG